MYKFFKPENMKYTDMIQISMDVLAWLEKGQLANEYPDQLKWNGEFMRYLIGWVTQEEEDSFSRRCNEIYSDLTSSGRSYYLPMSKGLSGFLRHNRIMSLFSSTGSVELSNIIATSTGFKSHQLGKSHINPMAGRFGRKSHQRKRVTSICQNYNGTAAVARCFQKAKMTQDTAHIGASVYFFFTF